MNGKEIRTPPPQWSGVSRLPGLEGRIPSPRGRAVALSTVGSLGDLYPVLSVARALEARGIEARLALSPEDCDMARRWGLLATPIGPSQADVCDALGMTGDEVAASVLKDPGPLISRALMPLLPDMTRAMAEVCCGAACVSGTTFAVAAPLAAEMAGLPYVPLTLQPLMLMSAQDPAAGRAHRFAIQQPQRAVSRQWNRFFIAAVKAAFRLRHGRELSRVRDELDLPKWHGTPLLDHGAETPKKLGLWSAEFAPLPSDAPDDMMLAGFPRSPLGDLPPEVRHWIEKGPPPLVITLGSISQKLGREDFWREAVAMARRMGLRAVLLHGEATAPEGPDLLPLRYAAHAPLFPMAAAIVHHGGIGTTAEALRSGRPQLVLPVGGDQPDNAARLVRMGIAETIPILSFNGQRGAAELGGLLDRYDYARAATLAEGISDEDGADFAARQLEQIVLTA